MDWKGRRPPLEPHSERPRADAVLDTVGLYCPVPIIKTAARIREMTPGQVLEVLSDDRVILVDMPAWCTSAGHDYVGHLEDEGEIHLFIRKAGRSGAAGGQER